MEAPSSPNSSALTAELVAALVVDLATALIAKQWMLASAESCTGGMLAAACTDLAGSSAWFERGYVCYSNAAKIQDLQVPASLIAAQGAVSEAVALCLAENAAKQAAANVAVAISGIAGPGGGSALKPVGTVCFGFWINGNSYGFTQHFAGSRAAVRSASVDFALRQLLGYLI